MPSATQVITTLVLGKSLWTTLLRVPILPSVVDFVFRQTIRVGGSHSHLGNLHGRPSLECVAILASMVKSISSQTKPNHKSPITLGKSSQMSITFSKCQVSSEVVKYLYHHSGVVACCSPYCSMVKYDFYRSRARAASLTKATWLSYIFRHSIVVEFMSHMSRGAVHYL